LCLIEKFNVLLQTNKIVKYELMKHQINQLELEAERKRKARDQIESIMGKGKVITNILDDVEDYAQQDTPLLIEGETGVGKKEIVNYIHSISPRYKEKLVTVDCGTITDTLAESELFGNRKGAYTDAKEDRIGLIEAAKGGILFLDEINSLTKKIQSTILRLIEEKEFIRVGDTKPIKTNIRIIAAGNENFKDLVKNGLFRKDLFQRFVGKITIPTLKERQEDIDFFIDKFLKKESVKLNKAKIHIDKDVRYLLKNYQWGGNVRELMNVINTLVTHVRLNEKNNTYIINPKCPLALIHQKSTDFRRINTAYSVYNQTITMTIF
jgi:transcriptional regulator with PAS, ATPase and Fis domain